MLVIGCTSLSMARGQACTCSFDGSQLNNISMGLLKLPRFNGRSNGSPRTTLQHSNHLKEVVLHAPVARHLNFMVAKVFTSAVRKPW